jgi:hypothetical protein
MDRANVAIGEPPPSTGKAENGLGPELWCSHIHEHK